jgi:hypothetical protein
MGSVRRQKTWDVALRYIGRIYRFDIYLLHANGVNRGRFSGGSAMPRLSDWLRGLRAGKMCRGEVKEHPVT